MPADELSGILDQLTKQMLDNVKVTILLIKNMCQTWDQIYSGMGRHIFG